MNALRAGVIPSLAGSVMFTHAVEVYLRHYPIAPGVCVCGYPPCNSRSNATTIIVSAGIDPASLTATDAHPRPWHERPLRAVLGLEGASAVPYPAGPGGASRAPVHAVAEPPAWHAAAPARSGRWPVASTGHLPPVPHRTGVEW